MIINKNEEVKRENSSKPYQMPSASENLARCFNRALKLDQLAKADMVCRNRSDFKLRASIDKVDLDLGSTNSPFKGFDPDYGLFDHD